MNPPRTRAWWKPRRAEMVFAIVLGALLCFTVSAVLSVTTDEPRLEVGVEELAVSAAPGPLPAPFDAPANIVVGRHGSWCRTLDIYRINVGEVLGMNASKAGAEVVYEVHTIGFPFPAMRRDFIFGRGVGGEIVVSPEATGLTERGFVQAGPLGGGAAAVAAGFVAAKPRYFIPIRPDVLGWALNLPLYTLLALMLMLLPRRFMGLVRGTRGRCPGCGYARGNLDICPECGLARGGAA